jgi:nitric oxide reductase NorD protein
MTSQPPSSADARGVTRARWRAAIARVAAVSATLAQRYQEQTAPVVGHVDAAALDALADAGIVLRAQAGWRGERLAQALFAAGRQALVLLAPGDVAAWSRLALRCGDEVDDGELLQGLPEDIVTWEPALRSAWLTAALAVPVPLAVAAYRELPRALARLGAPDRPRLLGAWQRAAADGAAAALAEVTPLLGALLAAVPAAQRADAVALVARVADVFPAGVPGLLRSLPRLYETRDAARVDGWAIHGLGIAARHRAAGVAFFGLASRTSERVLDASPTSVALDEVQGELRRLVHMLSGTPAVPRTVGPFRLRPPLEDMPASAMIALPPVIDRLDTVEDNTRLYRLAAALLAGRREHGTYDALPGGTSALRAPDRPTALEPLFLLADGVRVAARLAAAYPGIDAELRWAAAEMLDDDGAPPVDVFDGLYALALHPDPSRARVPPWLAATGRMVLPSLRPLVHPDATAVDALRVAERLAVLFPDTAGGDEGLGVLPDLVTELLDAGAGDALPAAGDEGLPGATASRADDAPLPPALEEALTLLVDQQLDDAGVSGFPLDADALRRLIETLGPQALGQAHGDLVAQAGLYVTQLIGKRLAAKDRATPPADRMREPLRTAPRPNVPSPTVFVYDEWDHLIDDYRPSWCTLREIELPGDSGLFFDAALARHAELVPEVRRHFQRVRPERYRRVHGLEDGEVIDLNAVVDARVQRAARQAVSAKLYATRRREERDVATLFLLDMSASTDETAPGADHRIIDIAKDALVIMAAALEEIGDLYAVYGFSGQGRDGVEVYPVKAFGERLTPAVQSRIGGLEPRGSTRMGTALRHALTRMAGVAAPSRHLVLLSDGFPQDLDYGADRTSHTHGIRDTAVALRELERGGVRPFCITVDLASHDYLRQMCAPEQYLVIETVGDLPRELPKIYQRLVRAA